MTGNSWVNKNNQPSTGNLPINPLGRY